VNVKTRSKSRTCLLTDARVDFRLRGVLRPSARRPYRLSPFPSVFGLVCGAETRPGVRFVQETITAVDSEARQATTDGGVYEADVLVVALGADYDLDARPGLGSVSQQCAYHAPCPIVIVPPVSR
jgi:glycine/D-amino acid oxidase-like deaminating enzyme